jgi:hypothetical protein
MHLIDSLKHIIPTSINIIMQLSASHRALWAQRVEAAVAKAKRQQHDFKYAREQARMSRYLAQYRQ